MKDTQETWTSYLCAGELLKHRASSLIDSFLARRGRLIAVVTQQNKARLGGLQKHKHDEKELSQAFHA